MCLRPDTALPRQEQRYAIPSTTQQRALYKKPPPAQHLPPAPNAVSPCLLPQFIPKAKKGKKKKEVMVAGVHIVTEIKLESRSLCPKSHFMKTLRRGGQQ